MTLKTVRSVLMPFAFVASLVLVSCGDDEVAPTSTSAQPTTEVASTPAPTSPPATTQPVDTTPATTEPITAPSTTVAPVATQVAVWPDPAVVFTTPEAAAADFVQQMLGVPPVLGTFVQGDGRSGEIDVLSPGEGGPGSTAVRSRLLLRQLGPDDGWFVLAAVEPNVAINSPAQGDVVPAAPLTVAGEGRGYEATIIVRAAIAGTTTPLVDPVIAMGGSLEVPEPYTATVDLTGVPAGSTVTILVRGDTGLETDPGEFSAIAVTIGP